MASESTARLPPTPLRRRMYLLKRTSRSISTAGSSTRNGEEDEDADSPPTLFEDPESPDYEHEMEGEEEDEQGGPHSTYTQAEEEGEAEDGEADFEDHDVPAPRPWYKPSIPVLLALAPPIGNWLTGGDHLKDLLLLLLLIFYLHQLVEVPWSLYHAARPRRSLSSPVPNPATLTAARAKSELRAFEILLLLFCLLAPALGVFLLRSLASLSGTSPNSREPISWFSTSLFALATAIRPLRELVARIASRTSTLHTVVHSPDSSPSTRASSDVATKAEIQELGAQIARLEAAIAHLPSREEVDAIYAYIEDALGPLERGVRRVERRVGKLRTSSKTAALEVSTGKGTTSNTIFVPAPFPRAQSRWFIASWFGSQSSAPIPPPPPQHPPSPISPTGNGNGKRRALDSIPEEGETSHPVFASTSALPHPPPPLNAQAHGGVGYTSGLLLGVLLREWLAAGLALLLYPLYVALLPVRGALRALVGVEG